MCVAGVFIIVTAGAKEIMPEKGMDARENAVSQVKSY